MKFKTDPSWHTNRCARHAIETAAWHRFVLCVLVCAFVGSLVVTAPGCGRRRRAAEARRQAEEQARLAQAEEQNFYTNSTAPVSDSPMVLRLLPANRIGITYERRLLTGPVAETRRILSEHQGFEQLPDEWIEPETLDRLAQNGIQVVPIPLDQVDEVLAVLPQHSIRESTWMGQVVRWTPITASGAVDDQSRTVRINDRHREFDNGRFRLLLRSYLHRVPDDPALRVEVLPQFHQVVGPTIVRDPFAETLMGTLFDDLVIRMDLDGRYAVLIYADNPRAGMPAFESQSSSSRTDSSSSSTGSLLEGLLDEPPPSNEEGIDQGRSSSSLTGPDEFTIRSLGEELLNAEDGAERFIIVLRPRMLVAEPASAQSSN